MWASENSHHDHGCDIANCPESITVGCNGQAILTMADQADQHAAWIQGYLLRGSDGLDSETLQGWPVSWRCRIRLWKPLRRSRDFGLGSVGVNDIRRLVSGGRLSGIEGQRLSGIEGQRGRFSYVCAR
jgi:hypothetical protein